MRCCRCDAVTFLAWTMIIIQITFYGPTFILVYINNSDRLTLSQKIKMVWIDFVDKSPAMANMVGSEAFARLHI